MELKLESRSFMFSKTQMLYTSFLALNEILLQTYSILGLHIIFIFSPKTINECKLERPIVEMCRYIYLSNQVTGCKIQYYCLHCYKINLTKLISFRLLYHIFLRIAIKEKYFCRPRSSQ